MAGDGWDNKNRLEPPVSFIVPNFIAV